MKFALLLTCFTSALATATSYPWSSDPECMVAFYLPTCTHSEQFLSQWQSTPSCSVNLYTVDCSVPDNNQNLCNPFNITGFPTVIPYLKGVQQPEYPGDGYCQDIVADLNYLLSLQSNGTTH